MISAIWKKAWRDLWVRKARSFFVIAAIAASTLTLGSILASYHFLERDMNASYRRANPHHLSLSVDRVDQAMLEALTELAGVEAVEARYVAFGRIRNASGQWRPLQLFSAADFTKVKIDVMKTETGPWPPSIGQIVIERQALSVLEGVVGEKVLLELPDGATGRLAISGLVHDVVLPQAEWENIVYGYVDFDSLRELGVPPAPNQIKLRLSGRPSKDEVLSHAQIIKDWLESEGIAYHGVDAANPGRHPHHQITSEMFMIMKVFGWFCCIFSGILVVNLLTTSLAMEKRQIGVMKAMGAATSQITRVYLTSVLCLSGVAVCLSLPFVVPAGLAMAEYFAKMMNFDIESARVPLWIVAALLGAGIVFPLVICYLPIHGASKRSIRDSLVDYGLGSQGYHAPAMDRFSWLSAPLLLSIRSAFRRKGRFFLNTGVLAAAAAFTIASFNIDATISAFVASVNQTNRWDLSVTLDSPVNLEFLNGLTDLPEVRAVSPFFQTGAQVGDDHRHDITLVGIDAESEMLVFPLLKGALLSGKPNEAMISQSLSASLPGVGVGDLVTVASQLGARQFRVCGIVASLGWPRLYVNEEVFRAGSPERASRFYVTAADSKKLAGRAITRRFDEQGLKISSMTTPDAMVKAVVDHFVIIFRLIALLAALLGLISLNGVFSSIGAGLLERTREFGILKAIGASRGVLIRIVVAEGVIMGLVGWGVAVLIALPMSQAVAYQMGMILLQTPMPLSLSLVGILASLILFPVLSALACLMPAAQCANRSVRDSLAYE